MVTFRKRPGPKGKPIWQAQIIRVGKRSKFRTFDAKSAAMEWARQIESAMDRGEWMDRTERDRTTLRWRTARTFFEPRSDPPGSDTTTRLGAGNDVLQRHHRHPTV